MEEIWKDIKGFEGKYKVSNLGRVKSLNYAKTGNEGIMTPILNHDGYLMVKLYSDKCYTRTIHRLVAETFIDKPKLEVNHLNGNKSDNCIDNLEWCTHSENEKYSWKVLGKTGVKGRKGAGKEKAVLQYDLKDNFIKQWKSQIEAGRTLNIRQSKISECCLGKANTAGGYKWKFKI